MAERESPGGRAARPGPWRRSRSSASPTLQIGGKAIWDNALFSQDPANRKLVGTEPNLTGFRFLRLMFYGDLYENINYRLEVDMAQAQSSTNPTLLAAFQDVWINFRELPVARAFEDRLLQGALRPGAADGRRVSAVHGAVAAECVRSRPAHGSDGL